MTFVCRESGLMLLALDSTMIPSYFIPTLGPAPSWCSSLENFTEELEGSSQATIYEDYKFLMQEELERLNLTNLIGTNLLRAYMHYFVNYRLYKKAKSIADPVSYDVYLKQRKREQLEKTFANQITLEAMGFRHETVLQVYFACNKNEELAANYLLDHMDELNEDEEMS